MIHEYGIEYKNVRLRQLRESDIENLRKWRNNPENTKYLQKTPYITKEMQSIWYQKYLLNDDEMIFAIEETQELKKMVGSLSLYKFVNGEVEFGKILIGDREAHGRKLGTHALKAVLTIAFCELKLNGVYLHVLTENKWAIHSYKQAWMEIISSNYTELGEEYTMYIDKDKFFVRMEAEYA